MKESRFCWRWFDWLGWALFTALGMAVTNRTGDYEAGLVMWLAYPALRMLAADKSLRGRG